MTPLFVDTSAFIASLDPHDQYHPRISDYLHQGDPLAGITSNLILAELLSFFSRHGDLRGALRFQQTLLNGPHIRVIWVDAYLHRAASLILEKFSNLHLSFTDASSFAIMRKEKLSDALAFDDDFKRAGFRVYPEP